MAAASGSFGRPHRPGLPGMEAFAGQVLHAADYRGPTPLAMWADGTTERLDALILATDYRPHLPHLAELDAALDRAGLPHPRGGASPAHPGLAPVGLEWQRILSSNTLRGSAGMPPGRPAVWPPTWPAADPCPLGSMCVNIDICRM